MDIVNRWQLMSKMSLSISLLVGLFSFTIVTLHSTTVKKNKLSMMVYYAIIGQALFMCLYYISASLLNFRTYENDEYVTVRAALSTPISIFSASCLIMLTFYSDVLRELLAYQRKTNVKQIAVLIDLHFAEERKM